MYRTFKEIEQAVVDSKICKRVALAGAHDEYCLDALMRAKKMGMVVPILIGYADKIREILTEMDLNPDEFEIIDNDVETEWSKIAVQMIHDGKADTVMKGLMLTSSFMRPILDKQTGLLPQGNLLSQVTVLENKDDNKLFILTDCAINIAPGYEEKKKIIENAVHMAHLLGIECPKVAVLSALEIVNPKIPSTVDADNLKKAYERGEFKNCIVSGPFALDNAISLEAAKHKGVTDPVAGQADILVVPDLCSGNIFTKSLLFYAKMISGGSILGTSVPIVAVSRTDTKVNKYHAILLSLLEFIAL